VNDAHPSGITRRLWVAAGLGISALALTLAGGTALKDADCGAMAGELPPAVVAGIRDSVDAVLTRYAIDRAEMKSWRVQGTGGRVFRFALGASVPADFPTLQLNRALGAALRPFDAGVFATERTKARTVTMHIVRDGVTVWSVSLVRQPG
jgi:hypothetical protein